ncbi:Predicted arabinose efflux permease, MFS family [Rhizobium sp. RU35A]|uniref:MFS transporter n=1 Tax=Rhizobium sp. RU35A TaxID=1907414 RepID=UPI000953FCD9|nr:MFS transporter [Rhizobium sp. RU35A]SIR36045.1 Predicted arabinose efflux permease, MFS family [Rhizobium sp. RU35A]
MLSDTSHAIDTPQQSARGGTRKTAAWSGVFALSLAAFALIASEFLPVSLLTPIASNLAVTEGQAGQAISVSGFFAVITSLVIASVMGRADRKTMLLMLTGVMMISGTVVALAPNYATLMIGRALIGIVIGGFWSMSAATAMRLVSPSQVPRALSVLNGGNALATVVAAPLGSYLGALIGWRWTFFTVVPVALLVLVWLLVSLPRMPMEHGRAQISPLKLLRRPVVAIGMLGVGLFFMGQFTLFTYLRPYLEGSVRVNVETLSLLLLLIGVMGVFGTVVIGFVLSHAPRLVLVVIPALMALVGLALVFSAASLAVTATLLALWGFLATAAPVAWWTWLTRTLPDDTEAGGGLMVAVIQLAITAGAAFGGLLFDAYGFSTTFMVAAALLLLAAMTAAVPVWIAQR